MPLYRSASLALAGAVAMGCSAPVVDDVADASGAMTEGVVSVERMIAGDGATQTNVSAKFMRLGSPVDPDLASRVVGTKLDLPGVGACRQLLARAAVPSSPGAGALGSIELIDVGDVTLRAGAAEMPLAVRAFPEVGDLVSGMFYTSRDAASDLPAGATYTLEGTGSLLVDRFAVDVDAPPALDDVRVGGAALLDGVTLEQGAPVTVQWRVAAPGQSSDLVLVDVSAESGASVRCTFRDAGQGILPTWVMRSSVLGALPATAALSVHRVRERAFVAPGIDTGEVRFDLSVMGRVVVTPVSAARAAP